MFSILFLLLFLFIIPAVFAIIIFFIFAVFLTVISSLLLFASYFSLHYPHVTLLHHLLLLRYHAHLVGLHWHLLMRNHTHLIRHSHLVMHHRHLLLILRCIIHGLGDLLWHMRLLIWRGIYIRLHIRIHRRWKRLCHLVIARMHFGNIRLRLMILLRGSHRLVNLRLELINCLIQRRHHLLLGHLEGRLSNWLGCWFLSMFFCCRGLLLKRNPCSLNEYSTCFLVFV